MQNTLKKKSIRPSGFSKYCVGLSLLNSDLRRNSLKDKYLLINKIENEYNRSNGRQY
jgi:hypothetical protein